jgi:signal transduction histidine kinase
MLPFFAKAVNVGVQADMPKLQARAVILANSVALIAAVLSSIILAYITRNGWTRSDWIVLMTVITLWSIPLLNKLEMVNVSRFLLTLTIPLAALFIALMPRIEDPDRFTYLRTPGVYVVLLATSIIPLLVFSIREKRLMFFCIAINFMFFALLDPMLRYYSASHEWPDTGQYISANLILLIMYIFLTGSVLSLKNIVDKFEVKNEALIQDLNQKNLALEVSNRELYELNKNIETQNEEIQAQSEELMQSQESLIIANNEIERQKVELEQKNDFLEKSLDEKSKDLLYTNQQLVTQNNELQQFSYTVSHNLRGPVASILGLINIHRITETELERKHVLTLLERSAQSLETIIHDLNKIIDIRNDKFLAFENVYLEDELDLIRQMLHAFITQNDVFIDADFRCDTIYSIKSYINSIMYNLVSNAIQYRSPERKPVIRIVSEIADGHTVLKISDNGLGIDLTKFGNDLFKLYKRFHDHTQGKGLGLFIVRQQIEKLNGRIEVSSKPGQGTTFRVLLPLKNQAV